MSSNINVTPVPVEHSFTSKPTVNNTAKKDDAKSLSEPQKATQGNDTKVINTEAESESLVSKIEKVNANTAKEAAKEVTEDDVEKALEVVSSFINSTQKQVDFSRDNDAGKLVITVTDRETQEVINQFPSEKIISMAEKIQALHQEVESISGLIIDSHV